MAQNNNGTTAAKVAEIKRFPTVTNPIKADDLHTPQAYAYTLRRAIVTDCNDRQRAELVTLLEGKDTAEGVTFNNTKANRDRLHIWQNSESRKERAAILGEGWQYIEGLNSGTEPGDLITCIDGTRGRVTKSDAESCVIEFETKNGQRLSVAGYFRYTTSEKSETADERKAADTMKRYTINCHYDMAVTVEVFAENEEQAKEFARERADRMELQHDGMCVGYQACVTDCEDVPAEVLRAKEREAVKEAVEHETEYMSEKDWLKQDLANIAYRDGVINWALCATSVPNGTEWTRWLQQMFREIARGERKDTALYNRYARLVARHEFDTHYKNFAKSLYAADCEGGDKLQKKQAVIDGVRCLCDKMEEYVTRQDDPDYKGWEPQMIIRYESETGDEDNYWNLFVYCEGPNDRNDDDYLSLRTSWQHVWTDCDGKDATDDYGSEEHETRAALLRYLFYDDAQEFDETDETVSWERITDVWVD